MRRRRREGGIARFNGCCGGGRVPREKERDVGEARRSIESSIGCPSSGGGGALVGIGE